MTDQPPTIRPSLAPVAVLGLSDPLALEQYGIEV